jgi:hypothetical protein
VLPPDITAKEAFILTPEYFGENRGPHLSTAGMSLGSIKTTSCNHGIHQQTNEDDVSHTVP